MRLIAENTTLEFIRQRRWSYPLSAFLSFSGLVLFALVGLNFGIDFAGGTLIEVKVPTSSITIGSLRQTIAGLNLGDAQLQEFGSSDVILIRIERQPGGDADQQVAMQKVRNALPENLEYRRVEVVGPSISGELVQQGTIAVIVAIFAVLIYLWFRFEWPFAIGAVIAILHDVVLTMGLFSVLQLEFNLSAIAAILTIVGYSLNDTVVVFDRIRESLQRYKKKSAPEIINLALNQTLSRTIYTSITTLLALLALHFIIGAATHTLTTAMIWGVIVGTYSSIFIASPMLLYLDLDSVGTRSGD